MNWLNIHLKMLRSKEYIGSAPEERGTWLSVLGHSCDQENGGRILGGASWKDRQWQQTCGVTLNEIRRAKRLLLIDGEDVVVFGYPLEKQAEVEAKREAGRVGGLSSGKSRASSKASSNGDSFARTEREGEGEGEGEREREREKAPPSGDAGLPLLVHLDGIPVALRTEAFATAWSDWIAYRRECKIAKYKPRAMAAQLATLAEWGPDAAIESIRQSIRQQWRGLFEPKEKFGEKLSIDAQKRSADIAKGNGYEY